MEDWPLPTVREFGAVGALCTFSSILAAEQLLVKAGCTVHRRESANRLTMAYISSRWYIQPSLLRVGGTSPLLFMLSTITSKVVVYAPAERADTRLLFLLYPILLCGTVRHGRRYGPPITVQIKSPPAKLYRTPCWVGSLRLYASVAMSLYT
jgi:hypothetical protein